MSVRVADDLGSPSGKPMGERRVRASASCVADDLGSPSGKPMGERRVRASVSCVADDLGSPSGEPMGERRVRASASCVADDLGSPSGEPMGKRNGPPVLVTGGKKIIGYGRPPPHSRRPSPNASTQPVFGRGRHNRRQTAAESRTHRAQSPTHPTAQNQPVWISGISGSRSVWLSVRWPGSRSSGCQLGTPPSYAPLSDRVVLQSSLSDGVLGSMHPRDRCASLTDTRLSRCQWGLQGVLR
jgi:hypothetical protein